MLKSYSQDALLMAQPKDLADGMAFLDSFMDFNFGGKHSSGGTESSKAKERAKFLLEKRKRRRIR